MTRLIVYLAMDTDGEIKFASEDREDVEAYIDNYGYEARDRAMQELGMDEDADEKDLAEAEFYAGTEGDFLELHQVNISGLDENDEVTLEDGTELSVGDILEKLNSDDNDDED